MGNWNITIRGVGCHHNRNLPKDADRMAARFVEELKLAGHSIIAASITAGGENEITNGAAYEKAQTAFDDEKITPAT